MKLSKIRLNNKNFYQYKGKNFNNNPLYMNYLQSILTPLHKSLVPALYLLQIAKNR